MSDLVSPKILHQILMADYENGKLFWMPRDARFFKTDTRGGQKAANAWNAKFSEKEAFTAIQCGRYYCGRIFNRTYLAHRVLIAMRQMSWPIEVDHINMDGLDNRAKNLRACSHKENTRNTRRAAKTSAFLGVSWCAEKGSWSANIQPDSRKVFLGRFDSEKAAAKAYDAAAIKHFGEFANLNFPNLEA